MDQETARELAQEIQWIRKLLVLQTLALGYKQKDLALALNVSEATISRMMPKGLSKTTSKDNSIGRNMRRA